MDFTRSPMSLRFGDFTFDESDARLAYHGRPVSLAPKAFGVLAELLRNAGRLVTKDALLDAIWGHRHLSESVLKTTIKELRCALGDDARNPRWIETASRRGYRFIGATSQAEVTSPSLPATPLIAVASPVLIGRESALASLHAAWADATVGQRQICLVAGEAGIGKSALIERFAGSVGSVATGHGQCIERIGQGEPYLPVLEALACLARANASMMALLRRIAPTWLLQMPWLVEREELQQLQASLASSGQDRMLREFSELVEQFTVERPLLLVIEDMHWCDEATVRLLDHVARRRPAARLMWLGSFRAADLLAEDHPLEGLRHELGARRLCEEIRLEPFSEAELAAYLFIHRPELAVDAVQVRRLHRHTDGLPLYVVNALDELKRMRDAPFPGEWPIPDSLAGIIECQRARLVPELADLLDAASVCGVEFDGAIVAAMLDCDEEGVALRCNVLVRQGSWLNVAAPDLRADGALDLRFAFRHALYREVLYRRIAPTRRAAWHRRAASAIEQRQLGSLGSFASVLALHHERGLDALPSMRAYGIAAERALARFSPQEALLLANRGLSLLACREEDEGRCVVELPLQLARGTALAQSSGISTPEGRAAYRRCAELYERVTPSRPHAWVITGLIWMFDCHGEYREAEAMALRLRASAEAFDDDLLRLTAAASQAAPLLQRGRIAAALVLVEEARRLAQALGSPRLPATVVHDPIALALALEAVIRAWRGEFGKAEDCADRAISRAEQLAQPMVLAMVSRCANLVQLRLGRAEAVLARAQRVRKLVLDHRLEQGSGLSLAMLGWARARSGDGLCGLREAEEGCAAHAAIGMSFEASCVRYLAADAALAAGDLAAAQRHIEGGLAIAERIDERLYLPDLWMARATLLLREGDPAGARVAAQISAALAVEIGSSAAGMIARLMLCELPAATTLDLTTLRAVRCGWLDSTPWPVLARVDALLSASPVSA